MPKPTDTHYNRVVKALAAGRVIPFLGAGVNLCARPGPGAVDWAQQRERYLPSGAELAEHLADGAEYPGDDRDNLLHTAQYVAVTMGSGPLYDSLHDVFDQDYPLTRVHRFLAALPATLRAKGYRADYPLIVTTNYDDLMERGFQEAGQPCDVVSYVAEGAQRGKFVHWPPTGAPPAVIDRPNEYLDLDIEQRPVVFKIHGDIDRASPLAEWDSYVITEDHYIDYLARTDPAKLIPATLLAKLMRSHFLFLGYSLSDWNLRVILHRIWGEQKLSYKSWAVQLDPGPVEEAFWAQRGVEILDLPLQEYVDELSERVDILEDKGGAR